MKLNNTQFSELQGIVKEVNAENPEWRLGQTFFNVLCDLYPEISEEIRGSKVDPFYYDNEKDLYLFFKFITE
jgi:hypothetical protein